MPEPTKPIRIAEHWTDASIDPDIKRDFLENFVLPSEHYSSMALGTLAAGQAHFEIHADIDDVTLIYPHPMLPQPERNEPLRSCLTLPGHGFKYDNSIDGLAERGDIIVLSQPLPSPVELIALPKMNTLARRLNLSESFKMPIGLGYIGLSRATIGSTISLGFANPFIGQRTEESLNLELLKEQHGFPFPKATPRPWYAGGTDHS